MGISDPFESKLEHSWNCGKFLCLGLDSDFNQIPRVAYYHHPFRDVVDRARTILNFNQHIIKMTADMVGAYKINLAPYLFSGGNLLRETIVCIRTYTSAPVILDAKWGDVAHINEMYVHTCFNSYRADAVVVSPYNTSIESLRSFLVNPACGAFLMCRTSDTADTSVQNIVTADGDRVYQSVARSAVAILGRRHNYGFVAGASDIDALRSVREIAGDVPILVPGVGAQGGAIGTVVPAVKNRKGAGFFVSVSRSAIFASRDSNFAVACANEVERLTGEIAAAL